MPSLRHRLSSTALRLLGLALAAPLVLGNTGSNVLFESLMRMVCGAPGCTLFHCASSEPSGCCQHEPAAPLPSVEDQKFPCGCCFIEPLLACPDILPAPCSTASTVELRKTTVISFLSPIWNQFEHGLLAACRPPRVADQARARGPCPWSPGRNAAKGSRISAVLGRALI